LGKVISFSDLKKYLTGLKKADAPKGTILDTNVLISSGYEPSLDSEEVSKILDILGDEGYRLFATVNTRAEYLEFQRRLILTEALFDSIDEYSELRIASRVRAKIQTLKGSLKTSVSSDPDKLEVFNEVQLKKIKREFSAGPHSGQKGWLEICDTYLRNQITLADQDLFDRGVEYISPNDPAQTKLFDKNICWPEAINLCEKTGTAFSDSMILIALKSSKLLFVVTLDFDIGYAALSDPNMKDVVVPDRLFKEFKNYHFPN
jgi:hypothetical protein